MTESVIHHLRRRARDLPDTPAYGRKVGDSWRITSWGEYDRSIRRVARALLALDVPVQGAVGILSANRPEWAITCLGAMTARAVPVGVYQTCSPEQVAYVLDHAEATVVMVENRQQLAKVEQARERMPGLRHAVVMDGSDVSEEALGGDAMSWDDFVALADSVPEGGLEDRFASLESGDLASLIYTSGTTGNPKAVMLDHANLLDTSRIGLDIHDIGTADSLVSYLPMAHIAEQMLSIHMPAFVGYQIYYAGAPETLLDDLQEIQPTIFFGVPRVWERFHAGLDAKLKDVSGIKGRLLGWARRVGREHADALDHGRKPSAWLARRHGLAERLVLEKIRRRLGLSRTHIAATGAAPIRREILEMFSGLGVRIYEVYGLSETTGPGTWNRNGQTRLGTVGPVIPDVELHIAEDGEVLFRGPNVFRGYYKDPAATAEALDEDGWFHTGDLGKVDAEGFLTITGRKKEILVTSGGKNVAPVAIEAKLQELDLVGDAFVVGDGRRFLTALLTVEEEAAARFAAEHGIEASQVPTHDGALGALRKGVTATNGRLARVEGIRNFRVLGRRFSVDGGELTPTLKPRRKIIAERYSVEIEAMYEEGQILEPGAG